MSIKNICLEGEAPTPLLCHIIRSFMKGQFDNYLPQCQPPHIYLIEKPRPSTRTSSTQAWKSRRRLQASLSIPLRAMRVYGKGYRSAWGCWLSHSFSPSSPNSISAVFSLYLFAALEVAETGGKGDPTSSS